LADGFCRNRQHEVKHERHRRNVSRQLLDELLLFGALMPARRLRPIRVANMERVMDEKDRFGDKLRDKQKGQEDEYFARRDRELLEKLRQDRRRDAMASGGQMKCPRCGAGLVERAHHAITVDECPSCGGLRASWNRLRRVKKRAGSDGYYAIDCWGRKTQRRANAPKRNEGADQWSAPSSFGAGDRLRSVGDMGQCAQREVVLRIVALDEL